MFRAIEFYGRGVEKMSNIESERAEKENYATRYCFTLN